MQKKNKYLWMAITVLLPILAVVASFFFLGDQGGLAALIAYFGIVFYKQRALILHWKARKKLVEGDEAGAIQQFEKAVQAAPKKSTMRTSLAFMLLKTGHIDRAEKELEIAMGYAAGEDERNNVRSNQSLVLWKRGRVAEAIQVLEAIVEQYKTTALYSTLGYLYITAGDTEKALNFNKIAYEYNGQNAVILDNYACALHLNGQSDESVELYKTLMSLKPTFPDAYWNYGQVLESVGDLEKAAYMYRNALSKRFYFTSTVDKGEIEQHLQLLEARIAAETPVLQPSEETNADHEHV